MLRFHGDLKTGYATYSFLYFHCVLPDNIRDAAAKTAQLTTFDALEFPNSPNVVLFGAQETEILKSSLKKPQINKQTNKQIFTRCCISARHHTIYSIALTRNISASSLCHCKKVSSFIFRTVTLGASLSAYVLTSQHGRLGKYSLTTTVDYRV